MKNAAEAVATPATKAAATTSSSQRCLMWQCSQIRTLLSSSCFCCSAHVLIVVAICVNDAATPLRVACCVPDGPASLGVDPVRSALSMKLLNCWFFSPSLLASPQKVCRSARPLPLRAQLSDLRLAFVAEFLVGELLNLTKPAVLGECA